MTKIRVNKTKDYTVMSNKHFKEKEMSLKAKGLLSEMLSLPDDWDYSIKGLAKINKENEKAIKVTLDELKQFNYLVVTKKMPNETNSGRIEYVYDIYEEPTQKQETKIGKETAGKSKEIVGKSKEQEYQKQGVEKQGVEKQGVVFGGVEYNNIYNKIYNNKKLNNKNIKEISNIVVGRLNQLNGTKYSPTSDNTLKLISGRLSEGYTEDDLLLVVDKMSYLWNQKGNEQMKQYLRPSTLFRPTNFENYFNMKVEAKRTLSNMKLDISDFLYEGRKK